MAESLVDIDGYPRNDIDVHQVRHARHQIICLQNDLKALMKEIEKGLHEVHSESASDGGANASTKMAQMKIDTDDNELQLKPFVKVNLVSPGSPAEDAVRFFLFYMDILLFILIVLLCLDRELNLAIQLFSLDRLRLKILKTLCKLVKL